MVLVVTSERNGRVFITQVRPFYKYQAMAKIAHKNCATA